FILRSSRGQRAWYSHSSRNDSACGGQKISASRRKRIGIRHVVPRLVCRNRTLYARSEFCKEQKWDGTSKPPLQAALDSWVELLKRQARGGRYCMRTLTPLLIFCSLGTIEQKY